MRAYDNTTGRVGHTFADEMPESGDAPKDPGERCAHPVCSTKLTEKFGVLHKQDSLEHDKLANQATGLHHVAAVLTRCRQGDALLFSTRLHGCMLLILNQFALVGGFDGSHLCLEGGTLL